MLTQSSVKPSQKMSQRVASLAMRSFLTFKSYHLFRLTKPCSKAVLILGHERSGTSVLARALNFMGVDLGDDKFVRPTSLNPKGYFENEFIWTVHRQIGKKLKYRPAAWGYAHARELRPERQQLTEYVQSQFAHRPVWGWKDPRTNDLLRFWQVILRDLNIEPHYVIIVRNPMDVLASNVKAWNLDDDWTLRNWQLHTLFAFRDTWGGKRILVSYEELFANPVECLRRISTTLHLPWPADEAKLRQNLEEFIDPALKRSDSGESLEAFKRRSDVPQDIKDLYLLSLAGAESQEYFQSREFHQKAKEMYSAYLQNYGPLIRERQKRKRQVQKSVAH